MNCREARELLPWLAAGALPPEDMPELLSHLSECASCRAELAREFKLAREVRGALKGLPAAPIGTWPKVLASVQGIELGQLELRSFLVGLSMGLAVRGSRLPLRGELEVLGRKLSLFGKKGGA